MTAAAEIFSKVVAIPESLHIVWKEQNLVYKLLEQLDIKSLLKDIKVIKGKSFKVLKYPNVFG